MMENVEPIESCDDDEKYVLQSGDVCFLYCQITALM